MNEFGKTSAYVALFSEIGFVLLATVLVGVLGGDWLDRRLGTSPILALIGFGLGTSTGAIADWRLISRFLARLDEADKQ
jgi:ATP synthase protein I